MWTSHCEILRIAKLASQNAKLRRNLRKSEANWRNAKVNSSNPTHSETFWKLLAELLPGRSLWYMWHVFRRRINGALAFIKKQFSFSCGKTFNIENLDSRFSSRDLRLPEFSEWTSGKMSTKALRHFLSESVFGRELLLETLPTSPAEFSEHSEYSDFGYWCSDPTGVDLSICGSRSRRNFMFANIVAMSHVNSPFAGLRLI